MIEDDEMPRRRRGARAVAVEVDDERGLAMRILLHSPKDMLAGALAVAAIGAILTNALFLQAGRHPSPMFGSVVTMPPPSAAVVLPRPRPVELAARSAEPSLFEPKPIEIRSAEPKSSEPKAPDPKTGDPMTSLVAKSTAAPVIATPANVMRPPAPIPMAQNAGARRVAAVQRALTEYGYGQLKPTGAIGADTQAAITKFERDRKIPVTGQMSDRLVRELTAMIGHSID
jgi:Putative peptidoglycan binding domain